MTKNIRFYYDSSGWYADLPEWTGEKWELEMVMGADTFLEILTQGENEIYLTLSTEPFNECETLHYIHEGRLEGPEFGEGAWYKLDKYMGLDYKLKLWLCDVTKFVFGNFPKQIYFK
jgi:hypothetical protein